MSEATTLSKAPLLDFTKSWKAGNLGFPASEIAAAKLTLENTPFPTTRDEHWKYTRVTKVSKTEFQQGEVADINFEEKQVLSINNRLVFVNGVFSQELSAVIPQDGVEFGPISAYGTEASFEGNLKNEGEIFHSMNTLFAQDGFYLNIAKGTQVEHDFEILFVQNGEKQSGQVRNQIIAGPSSEANVVMSFQSEDAQDCFSNVVTEIEVGQNAHFHIDKLQVENDSSKTETATSPSIPLRFQVC